MWTSLLLWCLPFLFHFNNNWYTANLYIYFFIYFPYKINKNVTSLLLLYWELCKHIVFHVCFIYLCELLFNKNIIINIHWIWHI
jgi:hypothetical protein